MNKENSTVSIRLMTYNHEPFIRHAMDGIMMQETDFMVEVVVGDDFSQDQTLEIIRTYADTDKIKIKILERKLGDNYWKERQEKGRLYNFANILENCEGKYIALLDGDDYWTDAMKLQKQVDFLERNNQYSATFHNCNVINEENDLIKEDNWSSYKSFSKEDLIYLRGELITCTALFRNVVVLPKNFIQVKNGDTFLWHLLGFFGSAKFLETVSPSCRRVHSGGIWSMKDDYYRLINIFITYDVILVNLIQEGCNTYNLYKLTSKILDGYMRKQLALKNPLKYIKGYNLLFRHKSLKFSEFIFSHLKSIFS